MQDTVVVISPDVSLAGLIARTLRCRQIYCALLPSGAERSEIDSFSPKGLILATANEPPREYIELARGMGDVPVLALGSLAPALCEALGGAVGDKLGEHGAVTLSLADHPLFAEVESGERMMHELRELTLPQGVSPLATATERIIGFVANDLLALQYPVERNDPDAAQMLYNFAANVCYCAADWDEQTIVSQSVERIRSVAGEDNVLCAVSGGVDSAVCAKLAQMAVGNRLMCVFVDTGLFRLNEPQSVMNTYMDAMGIVVAYVDAKETFLRALSGVSDARDKERIASTLMTQVLAKQLQYDERLKTIVLGTNFNDTLYGYTSSEPVAELGGARVCEPIRYLFKDEVRRLALALELPSGIAERQPFPSSGLALRVMCDVTNERLNLLRTADDCFLREVEASGLERRLWQAYATLMLNPEHPGTYAVCLRASQAGQGCAYAARLPADLMERVTAEILQKTPEVTRVVYDLTPSAHYAELE